MTGNPDGPDAGRNGASDLMADQSPFPAPPYLLATGPEALRCG